MVYCTLDGVFKGFLKRRIAKVLNIDHANYSSPGALHSMTLIAPMKLHYVLNTGSVNVTSLMKSFSLPM